MLPRSPFREPLPVMDARALFARAPSVETLALLIDAELMAGTHLRPTVYLVTGAR